MTKEEFVNLLGTKTKDFSKFIDKTNEENPDNGVGMPSEGDWWDIFLVWVGMD